MQISKLKAFLALGWESSRSLAPAHDMVVVMDMGDDFLSASVACCSGSEVLMQEQQGKMWSLKADLREDSMIL